MDQKLFHVIYTFGQKNKHLYTACLFITKTSTLFFVFIYSALTTYLLVQKSDKFIPFLAVPFFVFLLNKLLRKIIKRQRPYVTHNINIPIQKDISFCMPSNHSASSAIIACTYFFIFKPLGIILFIFAFFTGTSRIVIGLHYPSDIAVGFILSLVIGFVSYIIII